MEAMAGPFTRTVRASGSTQSNFNFVFVSYFMSYIPLISLYPYFIYHFNKHTFYLNEFFFKQYIIYFNKARNTYWHNYKKDVDLIFSEIRTITSNSLLFAIIFIVIICRIYIFETFQR